VRAPQFGAIIWLALVCALTPAYAEKRVALVIGNDRYANLPANEQLQKGVNDARAIGDSLKSIGFDIVSGENLGRRALVSKLNELIQRLGPGDTAFFFFSGHGVALDGVNYILPADVPDIAAGQETSLKAEALSEPYIISELTGRGVRVAVIVLDACRTNPFARGASKGVGGTKGLVPPPQVQGMFAFYAASSGQAALDRLFDGDPNPNSVFTRVLAPALTRPGVDLATLALDVREEVAQIAQRAGYTQRPAYYDETIGGRVYLAGAPPAEGQLALEAAQAWGAGVQNTTSIAALDEFLGQFGNTPIYGALARERREELAKALSKQQLEEPAKPADAQQMAAATPPPKPAAPADDPCDGPVTASFPAWCRDTGLEGQATARPPTVSPISSAPPPVAAPVASAAAPPSVVAPSTTGPCGTGPTAVSLSSRCGAPLTEAEERGLKPKDIFRECDKCPEMVVIPAGTFTMGAPRDEAWSNEVPQHPVELGQAFAAGRFAVTFDEWDACVAAGGCEGYRPNDKGWGRGQRPVINVSWNDAKSYVAWLSGKTGKTYRLLSEAEREYVTRAGTTTRFWWGSSISTEQANYNCNCDSALGPKSEFRQRTLPVDSFGPNPWGLYQVHGNVFEWTEDCDHAYSSLPSDGAAWTPGGCRWRVVRGGSWFSGPADLRAAYRGMKFRDERSNDIGFRVGRALLAAPGPEQARQ
jgi:formylglycine-generating enzyme required for sulfatase activity/uncharacterized caspase-like protein